MNNKEKEFIESLERVDKNLKQGTRNELKKLICAAPLLLLFLVPFVPKTLVPILMILSTTSTGVLTMVYKNKIDKKQEKLNKEFDMNLEKLGEVFSDEKSNDLNKSSYKVKLSNKKTINFPNDLKSCIEIQFFEEYVNSISEFLQESQDIEIEIKNEDAINQFLNPLYDVLGNNIKIIPVAETLTDIILEMQGTPSKRKNALYVYDGECFYMYIPNKKSMILFPISDEEMFRIFDSNPQNYEREEVLQFFTEVYGPIDYDDEKGKQK